MSEMFTNIKVFPLKTQHKTIVANGSCDVAGVMNVKFTVMKGPKGVFASLPGRYSDKDDPTTGKKVWYSDVKLIDKEVYAEFQKIVVEATKSALGVGGGTKTAGGQAQAGEESQVKTDDCPW